MITTKGSTSDIRAIVKDLRANTGSNDMHTVFSDFCAISATAIRNSVDHDGHQAREDDYLRRIAHYTPEQLDRFAHSLALLTLELEHSPRDVLGEIYMGLEISSREQGQFFTPWHVCELMAALNFPDAAARLEHAPFLTLYEPACGAGAMVIAATQTFVAQGLNYQQQLHVTADDINPTAVHMAYIQFSLLGIPALVHHRNALSLEHFDTWATPMHVLGGWSMRLAAAPA
ncbi:N-6 DNA methylase [Microbacterium aurantiacum]|uniref:N-6 DNA methylase n=1 Tax=Microbacterium aurantiacum TaxID=162393 RepID=UPI000C807D71|nr:N-6 DNA methylase [Microbacterium aurantiacum]